jgi:hypothetical protein
LVADSTRFQLLLNHLVALACKIGGCRWLPATGRRNHRNNQKLQRSSHAEK